MPLVPAAGGDLCDSEDSLVYIVNSRTVRATQEDPVSIYIYISQKILLFFPPSRPSFWETEVEFQLTASQLSQRTIYQTTHLFLPALETMDTRLCAGSVWPA